MPRTSLNIGELPAGMPPTRRPPLLPTPTLPKTPQREQPANSKELPVRILCLDSGQGPPSALQLRRLLGFSVVVDHVAPADRCEVAVYENLVSEVYVNLQPERLPKDAFMQIVVKWCDWELVRHVLGSGVDRSCRPPEWWLASEELEERCSPYDAPVAMEHKDVPVESFALGCLLGYNTFVAHFDSARTVLPGAKTSSFKKFKVVPHVLTKSSKGKKPQLFPRSGCGFSDGDTPTPCCRMSREAGRSQRESALEDKSPTNVTTEEPSSSAPPAQPTKRESTEGLPVTEPTVRGSQAQQPMASAAPDSWATQADTTAVRFEPSSLLREVPSSQASTSPPQPSNGKGQRRPSAWQGWRTPVVVPVRETAPEPFRPGPQPAVIQLPTPKKEPKGEWTELLTPRETAEDSGGSTSSATSDPTALSPGSQQSPSSSGLEPPSDASPPHTSGSHLSPPHKSSTSPRPSEGFKVTQMKVHFEHCISALSLYFVDKQGSIYTLYRLEVRYSTICRIVLCKKSSTATTAYLHLLHTPLLYKLCAGKNAPSHCHREGDYIPKFDLSDTTPWDRAVEFGEGPFKCGSDVLGKSRVLRLAFEGPRHWEPLSNLIQRTCSSAPVFYAAVRELHALDLKAVPRPSVPDYGITYALLSVWSESFQVADELALDPDGAREVQRKLTQRAQECPLALEEALFELYFSISRGKVFEFRSALDSLYTRYLSHRRCQDGFTGSVIAQEFPDNMVKVRKVILTPSRRVYLPPQLVCKSRLLQHFDTEFALRVVVRDDDCKLVSFSLGACKDDFVNAVIKPPLTHGLKIGGRHFVFLGCSTSQLRSHGVWFYARDTEGRTADSIRMGVGDLSAIHSVPKFMARLGQSLGYLTVPSQFTSIEPDIKKTIATRRARETLQREYVFSDGIGRISHVLLRKVHRALELEEGEEPCAVQIRYGGCKGMLLLDPTLAGRRIIFRQSMCKFSSEHEDLYVLKTSKPQELKTKARILVPPAFGRTMFGVLDETGTLKYGQVFVQYSNDMLRYKVNDPATILEGDVIVTKNPCMHPGDIRKLTAVNVPQLHHVRDCIVFPAKGDRPHPDEMAGSDLDGDEYSVLWYADLIFRANCSPMHYYSDPPREQKTPIQIGLIANAHLVWADLLDAGINSRRCRDLAHKCSVNLDFAKCGDLKGLQNSEKPPMYPDFMEKQGAKNTYCSRKVLGQLYRNCKKVELSTEYLDVVENTLPDPRLLLEGREAFLKEARTSYRRYAMKIRALLKSYRIERESEALSGAASKFSMFVQEKSDPTDVCMVLESQVEHVIRKTREEFFSHTVSQLQENLKASAWYQVTYELQASEGGIQSFPWVVPDVIMRILADTSQSACDAVAPSRNSFTQRLGALLLDRTLAGGDGPSSADPKDETRLLNNLLKIMYDWIDCNREFLFVKEPQEVVIYRNIMREACVKVWNHKPE
ncbi:hypothetical protein MRX96_051995 [Rhipicephalus microplus]